jgi:pyruvate/2-oxoglutarate dehydrogenase complex dihydrolipoamide acyltransferase (E2) component
MSGFREITKLSTWRKLALGTWDAPRDPTAYGTLDLDCEEMLAYLEHVRAKTGEKVTLTHAVGKAVARAIATVPEVNAFVSRGRLIQRVTVDVFFQVAFMDEKNANLAGAKVKEVDTKSLVEIARELRDGAQAIRERGDAETVRTSRRMAKLPAPILSLATRAGAFLTYDMQMDLRKLGIPKDAFGSCMVTNVGVFGIPVGIAPLLPFARVPLIVTMGAVRDAAAVHRGALAIRKTMTLGVAFDHRVMDGYHAGVMCKAFQDVFADPAGLLGA